MARLFRGFLKCHTDLETEPSSPGSDCAFSLLRRGREMAASSSIVFMCFCSSRMDNRGTSVSFENDFYLNFSFVELFTKDCYQNLVVYL